MKKNKFIVGFILIMVALTMSMVGCSKLSSDEGLDLLLEAYNNTINNYSDIYQYSEKIYQKPTSEEKGFVINRKVNVNCAVNKKYELVKDEEYKIYVYEDKYLEDIDLTSKISSKKIAYNEIMVGETTVDGDKNNITSALFIGSGDGNDGKGYAQNNVTTADFYNSEFFKPMQLINKQIIKELGFLLEHKDLISFDNVKDGGIVKKGKAIDYNFKIDESYAQLYKDINGKDAILNGKRIWVQTTHNRIANIYVYQEEDLGGDMNVDYESYTFMIAYLGPKINIKPFPSKGYEETDMFDGEVLKEGIYQTL